MNDQQRDALVMQVRRAIMDDARTSVPNDDDLERGRTELFVLCRREYKEQLNGLEWRRPFYVPDGHDPKGFTRLRHANGHVSGSDDNGGEMTGTGYAPTDDERKTIAELIAQGAGLYYYASEGLATAISGLIRDDNGRHRRFDLYETNRNNSAVYMAIHESYFTQYQRAYDFPTLPAGTIARKEFYARMLERATRGDLTFSRVRLFPHGKGPRPIEWYDGTF